MFGPQPLKRLKTTVSTTLNRIGHRGEENLRDYLKGFVIFVDCGWKFRVHVHELLHDICRPDENAWFALDPRYSRNYV